MKKAIVILTISFNLIFTFSCCTQSVNEASIPCENYGTLYTIIFKNKAYYLPDSLGGVSVNGRIAVKVFFNKEKQTQDFVITNIRLFKNDILFYNFYKYYKMPINKYSYDPQTIKYYDFVNDFLKNQVSFIKNNLPEYCNKDVSISYLLPIGNK